MRLVEYIRSHHEEILRDWETFAGTLLPSAEGMTKAELRDHAAEILNAIAHDMESPQDSAGALAKSRGGKADGQLGVLGRIHADQRVASGFSLSQLVGEYRALRASVLSLWGRASPDPGEIVRFNETIDEALAESVEQYMRRTDEYRDQILGIVSHDLRNPLGGIVMGAAVLSTAEGLDDRHARIVARIQNSAKRMTRIVGDLIDLTGTRFGTPMSIARAPMDLDPVCQMVVAELDGSHPNALLQYLPEGDLQGEWDRDRLSQMLSNLVGNALQHGATNKPISVIAKSDGDDVVLTVHNEGTAIPKSALKDIFEPRVRHQDDAHKRSTGLGLGLYIAREVVTTHGGKIGVTSTDADGTTFTVRLPRNASGVRR